MANKNNIDGVPPLNDVAGGEIPAYKKFSSNTESRLDELLSPVLSGYKLGRKLNLAYTVSSELLDVINEDASDARILNVGAQGVGAPIEQFGDVIGAMRIRGVDNIEAIKSTQLLYKRLNDIAWERNEPASELFDKYDIEIVLNDNGTVDAPRTIENYSNVYWQLSPKDKSELDNVIEFDSNEMLLPREGPSLNRLFSKVKSFGYDIDPKHNEQLVRFEHEMTTLNALGSGLRQKTRNFVTEFATHGNYISDKISAITDIFDYDSDKTSFIENLAIKGGYGLEWKAEAVNDPDFMKQLDWAERLIISQKMDSRSLYKKYQRYIEERNSIKKNDFVKKEDIHSDYLYSAQTGDNSLVGAWSNDHSIELNAEDSYSLLPSSSPLLSISPNDNIISDATNISPIYPESAGGFNSGDIADVIAIAMQNNRVQIELTLIDSRSGETSMLLAQGGGRISYAMAMPM